MSEHNVVLLGPPGSGKGTQAKFIAGLLNVPHISTGEMFRDAVSDGSELGRKVKDIIEKGNLVPDELTSDVLFTRLTKKDAQGGFILDGFPRTLVQAEKLESIVLKLGKKLTEVLYFHISEDILLKRLLGRRFCPACGKIYNIYSDSFLAGKTPEAQLCPDDRTKLSIRADDNEETVKTRFANYIKLTEPIVSFYEKKNILKKIDAARSVDGINAELSGLFTL